jgi:polygalacturonase
LSSQVTDIIPVNIQPILMTAYIDPRPFLFPFDEIWHSQYWYKQLKFITLLGLGTNKYLNLNKGNILQALTIDQCSGIRVKRLNFQYAQQMHFTISRSDSVRISGVSVTAPEDSPNTDGIHISESTNVAIQNAHIGTGTNPSLSSGYSKHN